MPLHDGLALSLHVGSSAVHARPKRAMIVRMSAETLDALDRFPNHPPLAFEFGPAPGIHVGDAFFPMRPQKESSPHELYLRVASAAKPMAPLKLYANVVGKFLVERQLGDRVTDKVRQQTLVAKQQHLERQAILLDQPPIPAPAAKNKRKTPGSGTVLRKTLAAEQRRLAATATPSQARATADVRRRLVHCLAISPRLADDAVKMVGGANISAPAREDLLVLLDDVAEQAPARRDDRSPRPWSLKPQTWTEVRPFEWPKLTEAERIAMARQARMAFKALKIPESDPAWENVRYRPSAPSVPPSVPTPPPMAPSNSNRSSSSAQAESKRAAFTAKDAKLKSKQDPPRVKAEIQMKDESAKASRASAVKRAEAERPATPPDGAKAVASRRLPGSGYQAKKSPQPSTGAERAGAPAPKLPPSLPQKPSPTATPAGGSHARKTIPTVPSKPVKKEDESDREYERQREKREREKERQREEWVGEKPRQKERDATERGKHPREKEREREETDHEKRQRERVAKEKPAGDSVSATKRKTASQDTEETLVDPSSKPSLPKRRKLDDGTGVPSRARDPGSSGPKKSAHEPSPVPRPKIKKESSPAQASVSRRATSSADGLAHKSERASRASGSAKPRRRSPIYTSSEDEGEIPQPRRRNASPPPVSDRSNSSDLLPTDRAPRHHRTPRAAYPPATDHAALRALYQTQYANYLGTFSKIVAQKRKIEAMLNGDSEAEVDVMEPDDLVKLSMEHKSLKTELEHIHDLFTKGASRTRTD